MTIRIAVTREPAGGENRVALTPKGAGILIRRGFTVQVQSAAGEGSGYPDAAWTEAGASVLPTVARTCAGAHLLVAIRLRAGDGRLKHLQRDAIVVGQLADDGVADVLRERGLRCHALERLPRITRAQSMDVLSSQASLAGCRAVIEAMHLYGRMLPMMMTAAGRIAPARVMVMGAGVAGLQAIATARRMGAVVCATDVRPATADQVRSLGAIFVAVENEEFLAARSSTGYAREMSADYQQQQRRLISETVREQDIVITTALIPGKPAPVLVSPEMVASMRPGSVLVDLAVERGGNCPLSQADKVVQHDGVRILGLTDAARLIPASASDLYSTNITNFLELFRVSGDGESLETDDGDPLIEASRLAADPAPEDSP